MLKVRSRKERPGKIGRRTAPGATSKIRADRLFRATWTRRFPQYTRKRMLCVVKSTMGPSKGSFRYCSYALGPR